MPVTMDEAVGARTINLERVQVHPTDFGEACRPRAKDQDPCCRNALLSKISSLTHTQQSFSLLVGSSRLRGRDHSDEG